MFARNTFQTDPDLKTTSNMISLGTQRVCKVFGKMDTDILSKRSPNLDLLEIGVASDDELYQINEICPVFDAENTGGQGNPAPTI